MSRRIAASRRRLDVARRRQRALAELGPRSPKAFEESMRAAYAMFGLEWQGAREGIAAAREELWKEAGGE